MAYKPRRPPRKVSETSLERAALAYLERFAASAESLRRVLARKVERSARVHEDVDPTVCATWIEALIARYRRSGLLDDKAYAEAKTASLRRQGRSARTISEKLAMKGVDREVIDEALAPTRTPADELSAAARLAKRRRIGPFRAEDERADNRQRDLATLGRAGFSFDIARKVIAAASPDALDALIAEGG